jgi:anti-sigma factor (TIGR02949 family)
MSQKGMVKVGVHRADSPYSEEECEEIIAQLEMLLDGELDPEKEKQVAKMVEDCEYCMEQYNIERKFRKLIKNGLNAVKFSGNLASGIMERIKALAESRH